MREQTSSVKSIIPYGMSKPLFILRGRNRLTGEREVVSEPRPRDEILQMKLDYTNVKGTKKPYTHVKIEPYPPQEQLTLQFNNDSNINDYDRNKDIKEQASRHAAEASPRVLQKELFADT